MDYQEALKILWSEPQKTKKQIEARDLISEVLEKQIHCLSQYCHSCGQKNRCTIEKSI